MNRNVTAIILIVLGIGIYFTFTQGQIDLAQSAMTDNKQYTDAIENAKKVVTVREQVEKDMNKISSVDRDRLEKMIPSSVNNIHLIVDMDDLANVGHHFALTNVRAEIVGDTTASTGAPTPVPMQKSIGTPLLTSSSLSTVKITFSAKTTYTQFMDFLKDLETDLRIMDVSKLSVKASDTGVYEFQVELRTYWLKS